jgi:hypothetical protein
MRTDKKSGGSPNLGRPADFVGFNPGRICPANRKATYQAAVVIKSASMAGC